MSTISLRLPARLDRLEECRNFVVCEAEKSGMPAPAMSKLELILEELLVNVINHAYPDGDGEMNISVLQDDPGVFALELTDWGPPFDPLAKTDPDLEAGLEDRPIGGLGIYFVKQMADRVTYRRDGEANVLTISMNTA